MGKNMAAQASGGKPGKYYTEDWLPRSKRQPIPPTEKGFDPQLRPFDQTLSVFTVLRDHFMPKRKDEGVNY